MSVSKTDAFRRHFTELAHCSGLLAHQRVGFTRMDIDTWKKLVRTSVNQMSLSQYPVVFEVGCGNCSFLGQLKIEIPGARCSGCDAVSSYIRQIHLSVPNPEDFFWGTAPECLGSLPSNHYDLVLSHSVFQYFADHQAARETILHMLRMTKSRGWVFIGDVTDNAFQYEFGTYFQAYTGGKYDTDALPRYLLYDRSFFEEFRKYCQQLFIVEVADLCPRSFSKHEHPAEYRYSIYMLKA